jgi:hypothetical protein
LAQPLLVLIEYSLTGFGVVQILWREERWGGKKTKFQTSAFLVDC